MQNILPNAAARAIFLSAHGLAQPPRGKAHGKHLSGLIDDLGFVQVDSINTVERAHHMILWSRRQTYRPPALKRLLEVDRALFEHWTHDASVVPMGLFPFWKHRFHHDAQRLHHNWRKWFREGYEAQFDTILNRIARDGPVSSAEVGEGEERGKGGWWDWHPSKTALEWLWRTGRIAVTRRDGFRKVYDLTEHVVPEPILRQEIDRETLIDWACASAIRRLGFGDEGEIARYWNAIERAEVAHWASGQIRQGQLQRVQITQADGSLRPALIRPGDLEMPLPDPGKTLRILSPFDPALRDRARVERLFGFFYRIEVFVPEPRRQYGYYVFPVIEGDRLIGRLDAKALRAEGRLHLRAFWPEAGVQMGKGRIERLLREVSKLANFAGCETVSLEPDWMRIV